MPKQSANMQALVRKCVQARKKAGITQKQVAELMGKSVMNISAFENNRLDSAELLILYIQMGVLDKDARGNDFFPENKIRDLCKQEIYKLINFV